MGCCVSSDSTNRSPYSDSSPATRIKGSTMPPRSSISRLKATENRAPPPPLEEETVKEVLSAETPKWKPKLPQFEALVQDPLQKPKSFDKFQRENTKVENYEEEEALASMATAINKGEEISEVSEICSLSESVSTTTFNEEEARQMVNRSPAKMHKNSSLSSEFPGRRDRVVGKSPARRSEQSPARRSEQSPARKNAGSMKVVQSRDQMGNGMNRNQPHLRNSGENSCRRSRSPATRTENRAVRSVVGRSPSARRGTNQSPARLRTTAQAPENGSQKLKNPAVEGDKWPPSANESLENPLVSLECFIFL